MSITETPTWKQLEKNWANGFDSLMKEEQEALALWWLEAETMNGRLDQFFSNSSGDLALIALAALENLGMSITFAALKSSLDYFGDSYPTNREQRIVVLDSIEATWGEDVFSSSTQIIQELPEDFLQAAVDRLERIYALG